MISVLYADRPAGRDGIRDFSDALVGALRELPGTDAELVLWSPSDGWPEQELRGSSSLVLQYNPFSYGRAGFAPALLWHLRRRPGRPRLCVLVHEPYVPVTSARTAAMGAWQRGQLRALLGMADVVGVSTEGFRSYLPARDCARATLMPAGSPLPDARERRAATRSALGVGSGLVVALYGSAHATRLIEHCTAAIDAMVGAVGQITVLNLGFAAPPVPSLCAAARVVAPGPLAPADLAAHLAATDIALLPYVDGASTRRTTMIAALQQEACVLSTLGVLTDDDLAGGSAPLLTPVADRDAFVAAALDLVVDPDLRARTAAVGRSVFERRFAWPVLARHVAGGLSVARSSTTL